VSLCLLHVFPTFAVGGGQRRTVDLANRLGSAFRHVVVALDGQLSAAAGFAAHVDVHGETLALRKSGGIDLGNLHKVRRLLRQVRPDLLLTYNFGAVEAALANRLRSLCPHLHFEDGFGPDEAERQLPRRVWLRRLALSGQTKIIVPSRTLEDLALHRWGFDRKRVLYIPNGIDCTRYDAAIEHPPLDLWRREPNELVIGAVGMLRPEKNLARLIRAFARMATAQPARLVLVGEGSERPALEGLATQLGIAERVTFTGFLAEPQRAMAEFDIYALSSDTEQMPLGMVEAMAAGLPIVATNVGDVAHLLPADQLPYVVPKAEESLLTRCLSELVDHPDRRKALGAANRNLARCSYTIEQMVDRYAALFSEVTSARQTPSAGLRHAQRPIS
jgi:L-malate glycosyltransferase